MTWQKRTHCLALAILPKDLDPKGIDTAFLIHPLAQFFIYMGLKGL